METNIGYNLKTKTHRKCSIYCGRFLRFDWNSDREVISDTVVNTGSRFVDNLGACPVSVFWAQGACTGGGGLSTCLILR